MYRRRRPKAAEALQVSASCRRQKNLSLLFADSAAVPYSPKAAVVGAAYEKSAQIAEAQLGCAFLLHALWLVVRHS